MKTSLRNILFLLGVFLCSTSYLAAQDTTAALKGRPVTKSKAFLFEIQDVQFSGNKFFSDDELFAVIDSRNTDLGFFQYLIQYYGERVKRNKSFLASKDFKNAFDNVLRDLQGEIQYFNQEVANRDSRSIEQLYNKSGYHWTKVTYKYGRDTVSLIKTLTFEVSEGDQATLDTLVYDGIDSLPQPILNEVLKTKTHNPGQIYNESSIHGNINTGFKVLQDSGYYYTTFTQPVTTVLSETKSDSVYTKFTTGKRQRISKIIITDSLDDQSIVSTNMKLVQLEFEEGDWYNRSAVERSINNLYELTTFDVVTIDTISDGDNSDTTISLEVLLRYRKQQQISPAITLNQTTIDKFINFGFDVTYIHRNIFGAAQNFTAFFRPQLLNISRVTDQALEAAFSDTIDFKPQHIDWELQTGFQISQPYLWGPDWGPLGKPRISGSFNYLFSYRYLVRPLQLRTHYYRPTLTATFPEPLSFFKWADDLAGLNNFFHSIDVYDQATLDVSLESQRPIGYDSTVRYLSYVLDGTIERPENERALIENLYIYKVLNDKYDSESFWGLTSIIPSLTLIADRRDDFFTPTQGYYSTIAADYGFLISKFSRLQGLFTFFHQPGENLVMAYKARFGMILWRDSANSYVPFERHLFAGGSNSVRGWPSRELRAPLPIDSLPMTDELRILRDITGSGTLIEGSMEGRWNFGKQSNYFLSSIISEMGVVGFLDIGNTFHRLVPSLYGTSYSVWDIVKNLGIAAGAGLRYNTPVGPLRLDVATRLFDPALQRPNFKHIQIHIGLGHAF